jgi:uncharacterized RDD family membrane protein YckC
MRCPKCHYLSFDPEPRCRNCGYGFSLAEPGPSVVSSEVSAEPAEEFAFSGANHADRRPGPRARTRTGPVAVPTPEVSQSEADERVWQAVVARQPRIPPTGDLPLFVKGLSAADASDDRLGDVPLVSVPQVPRPPLSVRRKTRRPVASRPAPDSGPSRKLGPLDRDLLEDLERIETPDPVAEPIAVPVETPVETQEAPEPSKPSRAGAAKRLAAALVDGLFLGSLIAGLVGTILRWCDLSLEQASVLPFLPTATFLLLVGVGYLLVFTAVGGQTIGKMVLGLRVVGDDGLSGEGAVTVRQAAYRALMTWPSVLALGIGFLPALLGDERALHDRLAHTRVVRA